MRVNVPIVAIYDDGFTQLFTAAKIMRANIRERAQLMEHPLETGEIVTDHRIILPTEIELSIIIESEDLKNVYSQLERAFKNSTELKIQTRTAVYTNQIMQELPHEENTDIFDGIMLGLKSKEVQEVNGSTGNFVQNPANSNTVSRGQQTPSNAASSSSVTTGFN